MTTIVFINDDARDWLGACGDFNATLPPGVSYHRFEADTASEFVFGPPEVQFPYGSEQPIVNGRTYVFYGKIVGDVPHIFENFYEPNT